MENFVFSKIKTLMLVSLKTELLRWGFKIFKSGQILFTRKVCVYIYIYIYIYICTHIIYMYLGTWHYLTLLAHIVKYVYRHVCIVVRLNTHFIYVYIYIYPCRSLRVSMMRWLTLSAMSALVRTVRYMLV